MNLKQHLYPLLFSVGNPSPTFCVPFGGSKRLLGGYGL